MGIYLLIFFSFIKLIIFFGPGFFLSPFFFNLKFSKAPFATYIFYSVLLPVIFTPLLIYFLNHFYGLIITSTSVQHVLTAIFIASFSIFRLKQKKFGLPKFKLLSRDNLYFSSIIVSILSLLFYSHFILSEPLAGPDSPSYLYQSAKTINTGSIPSEGFDRHILQIIPIIFSTVLPITLEASTKLLSITLYLLGGLITYLLTFNLTHNKKISLLSLTLAFLSYPLARVSWDIYATLMASICIFSSLNILITNQKSLHSVSWVLISAILGSIFNIHAVFAFSSFVFFGPILIYILILNHKEIKIYRKIIAHYFFFAVLFFILTGLPLVTNSLTYIYQGVYKPIAITYTQSIEKSAHPNEGLENFARVRELPTILDFPLNRGYFLDNYGFVWAVVSMLGICVFAKHKQISKISTARQKNIFLLFALSGLLLTQQAYFGVRWFDGRYVLLLFPVVVIFGKYFLWSLFLQINRLSINGKLKTLIHAVLIIFILTIYGSRTVLFLSNDFKSPVNINEYNFYKKIDTFITEKNITIYYLGYEKEWLLGLNPKLKVYIVEPKYICTDNKGSQLEPQRWLISQAFCLESNLEDSLVTFSEFSGGDYYILVQTQNTNSDPKLFLNSHYSVISKQDTLYLLKRS